jgi:hypothetical protein
MSRRRYQRGQLLRKDDNWLGRWREDLADDTGAVKRVHKKQVLGTIKDFPTKRLAMRELERRLTHINNVDYRPTRTVPFAVFAKQWADQVLIHQKPSSQSSSRSHLNVHLVPYFGDMTLANIRMEVIQGFITQSKLSPKSTENVVTTMMSMWNTAQAWEYVSHNPFLRNAAGRLMLKFPAAAPSATYCFTLEEALAIIDKAEGRWKTFFRILAEMGMRPGEYAGLRVEDVGVQTLRVAQSIWQQQVQTPKTKNAVRTFAISASLAEEIRRMIDEGTKARSLSVLDVGTRLAGKGVALGISGTESLKEVQ